VQAPVALIVTSPDCLLAYRVLPGNMGNLWTLADPVAKIEGPTFLSFSPATTFQVTLKVRAHNLAPD
jgi:hypothetical protein